MYMYRYASICSVDIAISCLNMATSLFICFNLGAFAFLIWTVTGNDGEKEGVRLGNDPTGFELRSPKHKLQCQSMWITH